MSIDVKFTYQFIVNGREFTEIIRCLRKQKNKYLADRLVNQRYESIKNIYKQIEKANEEMKISIETKEVNGNETQKKL